MFDDCDLVHHLHRHVELHHRGTRLFNYVFAPDTAARESRKPYFHPLSTLAGREVTIHRPHDHLWHHGLAMTMAQLSGQNFWGGPTYVHGQGYVQLDNNGVQEHRLWDELSCGPNGVRLVEHLAWLTAQGATWLEDQRVMTVSGLDAEAGWWSLDLVLVLHNVAGETLRFGSPTTEGRPNAGYGGLFWRGPRSFTGGKALMADGREGRDELMGERSPWLAFVGHHDGSGAASTLLFVDGPTTPGHPIKWFVRSTPFAAVSFAFSFDEEVGLASGDSLSLAHRLVIGDGAWDRSRIEGHLGEHPFGG